MQPDNLLSGYNSVFTARKTTMTHSTLANWSRTVRERDGRCLDCGSVNFLHAHHVLPKCTHPDLKLELSNGRTLCYACHKREHERNRPVRPFREQGAIKPRRKTLELKIAALEEQVKVLTAKIEGDAKRKAQEAHQNIVWKSRLSHHLRPKADTLC